MQKKELKGESLPVNTTHTSCQLICVCFVAPTYLHECLRPVQREASIKFLGAILLGVSVAFTIHKEMIDSYVCGDDPGICMV